MDEALAKRPHTSMLVNRDLNSLIPRLENLHPEIEIIPERREILLSHEALELRPHVLSILLNAGYDITHIEQSQITLAEIYAEVVN